MHKIPNLKLFQISVLLILSLLGTSCNKDKTNCTAGDPTAIFAENINSVVAHTFTQQGQQSTEEVQFDNGIQMVIYQSGCEELKQEFQITFESAKLGNVQAQYLVRDLFHHFSILDERLRGFEFWANAINDKIDGMKIAENTELEAGIYIKIDKIQSQDITQLIIILSQNLK